MRIPRLAAPLVCLPLAACVTTVGDPGLEPDTEEPGDVGGGGGGGDDECASVQVELTDVIPTVMFLVDRSGTMEYGFGGTSRWNAVYSTLMNEQSGVIKRLENEVRFGLAAYTGADSIPVCPIIEQVPPAMGNHAAIAQMYGVLDPIEDTPTAPSITSTRALLEAIPETGPKIIVLATDGEPDTCEDPDPDGQPAARAASVAAAQAAHEAGIDLYIISVGADIAQSHLQDMANAGVGLPVGGVENAPYYQALNPDALVAAFEQIIGDVRSCSFAIDGRVDLGQADRGTVTLDGVELEFGTQWQLSDESTLELLGTACDTIMGGGDHLVEAEFTCGAVVD
ncbi:MAG TPA: vWA domain-containing protein [Kofleriaceae bacterium]|nr:vWA domain-containing protein [Kofleriaceae bacterium]